MASLHGVGMDEISPPYPNIWLVAEERIPADDAPGVIPRVFMDPAGERAVVPLEQKAQIGFPALAESRIAFEPFPVKGDTRRGRCL